MKPETEAKYKKTVDLIKAGKPTGDALKETGLSPTIYYKARRTQKRAYRRSNKQTPNTELVNIQFQDPTASKVIVTKAEYRGTPEECAAFFRNTQ